MTLSHGFRRLANALETLEANGLRVRDVATTDDEPSERLAVDLTVTVPLDGTELPEDAAVTDDAGSDAAGSDADESEQSDGPARERVLDALAVSAAATNGATELPQTDDDVDCPVADCDATFESDHGMKIHRTKVHGDETDGSDPATPAYRDPDRLREVYDSCDSFTEMREALETDVSTQTVRRQMIAHDLYEPGESSAGPAAPEDDEAADPDDESESVDEDVTEPARETDADDGPDGIDAGEENPDEENADGETTEQAEPSPADEAADDHPELDAIELPEGVTVADLKSAVSSAQTLYHVQQRFDLDRKEAMQLLETYDLLELVHGRVSHRDARKEVGEEEITRRILEHAPVTEPSRA